MPLVVSGWGRSGWSVCVCVCTRDRSLCMYVCAFALACVLRACVGTCMCACLSAGKPSWDVCKAPVKVISGSERRAKSSQNPIPRPKSHPAP